MRRKKHKQTRRATNYYRINYGFHEPYKVLLDGNFIHATKAINMSDLATHLPKLLGGTCKLYTTKCVTQELFGMGGDFRSSALAARGFQLHKCQHHGGGGGGGGEEDAEEEAGEGEEGGGKKRAKKSKGCVAAADCIRAAIGNRNEQHWFVATQDSALRRALGQIPGCPLVFATVNGVHLETPSEVTKQKAKRDEEATRALPRHERAAEPMLAEAALAELRREGRAAQGPGPSTSARFRRNKAKGPNPLASKKKVKKPAPAQAQAQAGKAGKGGGEAAGAEGGGKAAPGGGKKRAAESAGGGDGGAAAAEAERRRKRKRVKQAGAAGGGEE
ncbi:hypothetical protein HYH03_002096 [Edaphochlamys debaryana]|uniref:UTP23 sensor motif region domain-containing protein n=1 Tax=Edaphochlamys debaryana TaxID=47281 RepID=A0A835YBB1_9CHLO|nr:hypothetical protein HYH03_002096 [Edaphochlamys debaryana]|eukprot:KAG2499800.1 hypothetical protein HYH03_002096 [Edaphochlamys debaryana]